MSTKQATTPAKATTPVAPAATTPVAPAATVVEVIANAAEKIEAAAAIASDSLGMLPDLAGLAKMSDAMIVATLKQVPAVLGLKSENPDEQQLLAFAKKLKCSSLEALKQGNLSSMLEEFSKSGLQVKVSLDADAMKALGVKNTSTGWDWKLLGKWVAGGAALLLVSYGAYRIYVKYYGDQEPAIGDNNMPTAGIAMLP